MWQLETFPGYVLAGRNLVGLALWMRDHLPADATQVIREFPIGCEAKWVLAQRRL